MRRLLGLFAFLGMAAGVAAPPEVEARFESGTATGADGRTFPYRIHHPEGIGADDPVPLVVFLHGAGERGDDNRRQLRHFPERWVREAHLGRRHRAVVIAVQCPEGEWWSEAERNADDVLLPTAGAGMPSPLTAVLRRVRELAADPAIDDRRIYLTGLSMGGFGSWALLAHRPDLFAAAAPICGAGDVTAADRIAAGRTPVWAVHGGADDVVLPERSREMVEAIRAAGGRVGYTEIPRMGHDSWSWAYGPGGLMEWMFAQRRETEPRFDGP